MNLTTISKVGNALVPLGDSMANLWAAAIASTGHGGANFLTVTTAATGDAKANRWTVATAAAGNGKANLWTVATAKTATALTCGVSLFLYAGLSNAAVPQISNYRDKTTTLGSHQDSILERAHNALAYSVIRDPVVREFMLNKPGADIGAIQQILDLALSAFANATQQIGIAFEVSEEGATVPRLILRIDTYGLDFDRQSEIDLAIREEIFCDDRLIQAKKYMALSVW